MANYVGRYRTNYFTVSDEGAFDEWLENCVAGAEKILNETGVGFCGYDSFSFCGKDGEEIDEDEAIHKLQELLDDDSCCVIHEIGHEKFRYLTSTAIFITKNSMEVIDFHNQISAKAKELMGDDFVVEISY